MTKINHADRSAIFSRLFGNNIVRLRELLADGLIKLGVKPNTLTLWGLAATIAAAYFLARGVGDKIVSGREESSWYGLAAAAALLLAGAFDILDGAVARRQGQTTRLGGFLDSCCDRVADAAIFIGITIYYFHHPQTPHAHIFAACAMIALANAQIISYIKARAENFIPTCPVGYWQRGERLAAILIGLFRGHIGTVMVMLAILPAFTVLRRFTYASRRIKQLDSNVLLSDSSQQLTGIMRLALWRYRRGTLPYDIVTAFNICLILFVDLSRL